LYHDGTERPISRPSDPTEQKAYYSGKKKRHTVKNVMLAEESGSLPFLSDTYKGSTHGKPIADQTPYPLPQGSELLQDLGFVGFTLANVDITQPHKKPRGKELTDEQKADTAIVAHRRIRMEHCIASVKRCRIVKDTIRLWKDTARDMVMEVCCGLHNFRLRLHPWPSYP